MRELGQRAGISHTAVSMIETDKISPSLDTLSALLDALGTTLVSFFSELKSLNSVSPFYLASELPDIGDPKRVSYQVVGLNHPNRQILMLHESYAPGSSSGDPIFHDAHEAGFILKGAIELTVGTQKKTLLAGDAYYFDSRLPHSFKNMSEDISEIISAVTPPTF